MINCIIKGTIKTKGSKSREVWLCSIVMKGILVIKTIHKWNGPQCKQESLALGVWIMISQKSCSKDFYFGDR